MSEHEIDPARIAQARRYWAAQLGERYEDVPWEVVFILEREPTAAEYQRGGELGAELKAEG